MRQNASSGDRQSGKATLSSFALTHWSNDFIVLPVVRSRNEAIPCEIARKSPHMSPIFDLELKGLRALQRHLRFVDSLKHPLMRQNASSGDVAFFVSRYPMLPVLGELPVYCLRGGRTAWSRKPRLRTQWRKGTGLSSPAYPSVVRSGRA